MSHDSPKRRQARLSRVVSVGLSVLHETGASLLAFELYPLGMIGTRPPIPSLRSSLHPLRRPPVLLVHGVFHNWTAFAYLSGSLYLNGWRHLHEINLLTSVHSIPTMAEQVGKMINRLRARYGVDEVDIVGHSLGGIVARYFVQELGGDGVVRHLVTLGTPHQGVHLSRYSPLPHLKDLSPESPVLRRLNRLPPPSRTQGTAIAGSLDLFTQPNGAGFWRGVRNVELAGVGHAGLLFSRRVARLVAARLADWPLPPLEAAAEVA